MTPFIENSSGIAILFLVFERVLVDSSDRTEMSVEMAGTRVSATNSERRLPKATGCF